MIFHQGCGGSILFTELPATSYWSGTYREQNLVFLQPDAEQIPRKSEKKWDALGKKIKFQIKFPFKFVRKKYFLIVIFI